MSDSGLSDKFNQTYKSFNKLFTYIDNYRASEFNSYASNRLIVLGDLKKEINNLFEQFLKNSSLDSINFNIINFYISDLENVVEGIRVNEDPRRVEKFYGELVDIVE
ncbi:hypothetical protein [Acinetobacter baumannii]|nr:hypothetical protein [Acinetobacter baumannii]